MLKLNFGLLLIVCLGILVADVQGGCKICNSNGVACVDYNKFQICIGGVPDTNRTLSCPSKNGICTKFGPVCFDNSTTTTVPECLSSTNCGRCDNMPNGYFACTSRTKYTMCWDNALTDIHGQCSNGDLCDISLGRDGKVPCSATCAEENGNTCDIDDDIDDTTQSTSPSTPTPTDSSAPPPTESSTVPTPDNPSNLCSGQTLGGRYSYSQDPSCTQYVYCFLKNSSLEGQLRTCPPSTYFNAESATCGETRPTNCI